MKRPLIVGAGLSGAVLARVLADGGVASIVVDERRHTAGNCHTEIDPATGILVHRYGPHIFHTDDADVWRFVGRFARFRPFVNRVKAVVGGRVFAMPVNLHTINQFFGTAMGPVEAAAFVAGRCVPNDAPANFEEQALAMVGRDLYEAFFKGYTRKQWGVDPRTLPAAILKRLPLRFTYDDNYFFHEYQGMPECGYTEMVARMLDHERIDLRLGQRFDAKGGSGGRHVFYTGSLDEYFGYAEGRLGYRTLDFEEIRGTRVDQGAAVINYCDEAVPWTRVTDHKYFAPWRLSETRGTLLFREYSRDWRRGDTRFYPLRLARDKDVLGRYRARAAGARGVTFLGRLGTYRYLDMDRAVGEALVAGRAALDALRADAAPLSSYADLAA